MKLTMTKIIVAVFIIIVLLVGGLLLIAMKGSQSGKNGQVLDKVDLGKDDSGSKQGDENGANDSQNQGDFEPADDSTVADIPENLPPGVNIKKLEGESEKVGNATFVAVDNEGTLSIAIEANLNDPISGNEYFAWLAKDIGGQTFYKLGKLNKKNNKYIFSGNLEGDFSAYKRVIISSETNNDNTPELTVLEGKV